MGSAGGSDLGKSAAPLDLQRHEPFSSGSVHADPEQRRCESTELLPGLATLADECDWTEQGFRFRFAAAPGHLDAISRVIDRERRCCGFLTFRLDVPSQQRPFVLDLSGPPGTREFLEELGLKAKRVA